MSSTELVLHLGLEDGRNANAIVAGQALIAWAELAQEAASVAGDGHSFVVELISADKSSLRFYQWLRRVDSVIGDINSGGSEYPNLKGAVIAIATALGTAAVSALIQNAFAVDQTVRLSDEDRAMFRQMQEQVLAAPQVKKKTEAFFQVLEKDRAIKEVGIATHREAKPIFLVPRERFSERGGLWTPTPDGTKRDRHEEIDVILLRPDLRSSPHTWTFRLPDGSMLDATMADVNFLSLLGGGGIPTRLREGISMKIIVQWQERELNGNWVYVKKTRKVLRVLSPIPGE